MSIYTRTGDSGTTSVVGGRVDKDDVRVEAYGTIDEVNSFVGLAAAQLDSTLFQDMLDDLKKIQNELFDCGGDLASIKDERPHKVVGSMIDNLERRIDVLTAETPAIKKFILPGGASAAAILHVARTVTRRAERQVVRLMKEDRAVSPLPLRYLNRLSDYFFAAARAVNFRLRLPDVPYVRSADVFSNRRSGRKTDR
ncbi:MAG: cob(I)yrinic acid a,c-diamide adenosyltransferase [Sporolactobacillus sp.]|jgi:cob(I)alamin adenosyltransferase|nr:cob(I)yrinic acid a,c-diamide adenosyltransferase [Sporolactobacillus sp.]MCI1881248.1 cob(I)yrinic acid a,c-diamide adenosyltransferase [Sporolactobacillus sp.]